MTSSDPVLVTLGICWIYEEGTCEWRRKFITKIHADLVFGRVSRFQGVPVHLALQQGKS